MCAPRTDLAWLRRHAAKRARAFDSICYAQASAAAAQLNRAQRSTATRLLDTGARLDWKGKQQPSKPSKLRELLWFLMQKARLQLDRCLGRCAWPSYRPRRSPGGFYRDSSRLGYDDSICGWCCLHSVFVSPILSFVPVCACPCGLTFASVTAIIGLTHTDTLDWPWRIPWTREKVLLSMTILFMICLSFPLTPAHNVRLECCLNVCCG